MHSKSNNTEFMTYDNANGIVDELFEPNLKIPSSYNIITRYILNAPVHMLTFQTG